MYKLCLIQSQNSDSWSWFLQPIEPRDMAFDPDRAKYSGLHQEIRGAIKKAHELVPKSQVKYVYMDRKNPIY